MTEVIHEFDVVKVEGNVCHPATDRIAAEVPLEVRLEGEPFSVIMRTPGTDRDLVAGFLFSEAVIEGKDDLSSIETGDAPNVVNVTLARSRARLVPQLLDQRRQVTMNSSCGMCGRRTLESLDVGGSPLSVQWAVAGSVVRSLPVTLRGSQQVFGETGGLHAAGLFDRTGRLEVIAEDVGRHNAVDKLIGLMLLQRRLPLEDSLLFVSGRSSFEIVQKAFLAGVPLLGAVSAPSSLAIDLSRRAGITLLGFVRDTRYNCYAHSARIVDLHRAESP